MNTTLSLNRSLHKDEATFNAYIHQLSADGTLLHIGQLLERAARLYGDCTALVAPEGTYTYAHVYRRACGIAHVLKEQGIRPDEPVLLLCENKPFYYDAYWAIVQTGAVVAPLNTFLHPQELKQIITDSNPQALIVSQTFAEKYAEFFATLTVRLITEQELGSCQADTFSIVSRDPDVLSVLLYTSGTTGAPKGVMLSSRNIITNVLQGLGRTPCSPEDRILAVLPLFHSFGQNTCVWGPVLMGGSVVLVPSIERQHIMWGMAQRPTVVAGVPSLFGLFCLLKTVPFDAVRYCISGGDALPDKIRAAFALVYRRKICNGYGMTECSPVIAVTDEDVMDDTRVVGKPVYGMQCEIRDENGTVQQPNTVGTLWVKGANVMLGYYNAPEATAQVMHDGWLCTGDLALQRTDGTLLIVGREKDLIIHKGINIYPQEIENVLLQHAAIVQAAVVGVDDEQSGQVAIAFVALKQGTTTTAAQIREWCTTYLAGYKVPRTVIIQEKLPLTATAKVDKKKLKAEYEQATQGSASHFKS